MPENKNIYIPHNLKKGTIVQFHLDNIDFSEDTKDGRDTTHALNLVAFQQKINPQESLKIDDNFFNDLRYCKKNKKKDFMRHQLSLLRYSEQ